VQHSVSLCGVCTITKHALSKDYRMCVPKLNGTLGSSQENRGELLGCVNYSEGKKMSVGSLASKKKSVCLRAGKHSI